MAEKREARTFTFDEARMFRIPFGKFRGEVLDNVAVEDSGLRYLDWMIGQSFVTGELRRALLAYLSDPSIRAELDRLTGGRG